MVLGICFTRNIKPLMEKNVNTNKMQIMRIKFVSYICLL